MRQICERKKKIKTSASGSGLGEKKEWKFFNLLGFLDDSTKHASTVSNFDEGQEMDSIELIECDENMFTDLPYSPAPVTPTLSPPSSAMSSPMPTSMSSSQSSTPSPQPSTPTSSQGQKNIGNKKNKKLLDEVLLKSATKDLNELLSMAKSSFSSSPEMTQERIFFEGVIKQVEDAKLSKSKFAELQIAVLSLIHKFTVPQDK